MVTPSSRGLSGGRVVHSRDVVPDQFHDVIGGMVAQIRAINNWTSRKERLRCDIDAISPFFGYVGAWVDARDYGVSRVGDSIQYDVPFDKRGLLSRFRGKRVRIICLRSGALPRQHLAAQGGHRDRLAGACDGNPEQPGGLSGNAVKAEDVALRTHMVVATAPENSTTLAEPASKVGWTWLALDDPELLTPLSANWQLLVDQTRFSRIAVVTVTQDGLQHRVERSQYELAGYSAPGGLLRFPIAWPGDKIRGLKIGFKDIDHLSLMRKVNAMDMDARAEEDVENKFTLSGHIADRISDHGDRLYCRVQRQILAAAAAH